MKALKIEGTVCVAKRQVCASMGDKDRRDTSFSLIVISPDGRLSPAEMENAVKYGLPEESVISVGPVIITNLGEAVLTDRANFNLEARMKTAINVVADYVHEVSNSFSDKVEDSPIREAMLSLESSLKSAPCSNFVRRLK